MTVAAPIETFEEIDSTNSEARRRAEGGAQGPLWITARRQTAGRGRRGRAWSTQEGNLAASFLFTSERPPLEASQVSFVAALALADFARTYVDPTLVAIKWPNDLLLAGRKAAGILVESGPSATSALWVVVGFGFNLASAPKGLTPPATALSAHMASPPPGPAEALRALAPAFEAWRRVWEERGFASIAEAWTQRAKGMGEPCLARLSAGDIEGVAEGLESDGALRLRLPGGETRRITAGDVFF
ncbi:MAG: biotin--[acetyl-CoA-carboxylase] ligase [Caulobacteraceae bacterium]